MIDQVRRNSVTRWLAVMGIVTPILDVLVIVWLAALDSGYSHTRQYISELGETGRPYAAVFSAWCILYGLLFVGFAVALRRGLNARKRSWLGPGAFLVMAVGSILTGFLPCDPGCHGTTFVASAHILVGEIATVAIVLAPILTWIGMRRNDGWQGYQRITLAASALLLVIAGWMAVCFYGSVERSTCALGAAQRLFYGVLYVWVEVVAIRLCRMAT